MLDWSAIDAVAMSILEISWDRPATRLIAMKHRGSVQVLRSELIEELEDAKSQLAKQRARIDRALSGIDTVLEQLGAKG